MSVKSGYKQTEIGIIPEDWEVVELDNILEKFQNGYAFSSEGYVETGIPIISMANISLKGTFQFDYEKAKYWAEEELDNLKQYQLEKGDLIIAMTDVTPDKKLIGRMAIADKNDTFLLNQRVGLLKLKEVINNKFLCEYGNFDIWRKYSKNVAALGAQANISTKDIKNGKIPLPPIEEQKKIADILSTVDKKIAFVEENINATEELKKGLMQKLLTEGIGHAEFKDSELGRIPESWEVVELLKVCEDNKRAIVDGPFGSNLKTIHFREEGIPVIQSNFVTSGKFNAKEYVYVDEDKFNSEIRSKVIGGDIVMAKIGANCGTSAIIPLEHPNALLSGNSIKISVDQNKASTVFIDFIFKSMYSRNKLVELKSVGAQPAISMPLLKKMKIVKPLLEEQKQIAEILSTVDKKIENLKEKKQSFEELKKGLMQKLLTGEVRV